MVKTLPNIEWYPNLAREVKAINTQHGTRGVELALAHIAENNTHYRGTRVWVDFKCFIDDTLEGRVE
jgi:hypothetical protein